MQSYYGYVLQFEWNNIVDMSQVKIVFYYVQFSVK